MKAIREFMDQTEGGIARDFLETQGIHAELRGSRDYSTLIVGGTVGRYSLLVGEDQAEEATALLRKSDVKLVEAHEPPTETAEVALKKAVIFAVMAIIFCPWIGNFFSVRESRKYLRLARRSSGTWGWLFLISFLQVPGVYLGWLIFMIVVRYFMDRGTVMTLTPS